MKIVMLSPAHPLRGGIAASSERLARALQEAGHDVVMFSFKLQYPSFLFPGKTQFTDDPAPEDLYIRTLISSINPFNWYRTGRKLAKEKPDVVITRFWLPFMGPALGTILRIGKLFSKKKFKRTGLVDNLIPHERRPGDRLFSHWFVGACTDFVVMSRSVEGDIRQFSSKPVRFAPHPIYDIYGAEVPKEEARERLCIPMDIPFVLFFGFIRPYKGLDLLLEALAQTEGIHAIVAGECYEDWNKYEDMIKRLGLEGRVLPFHDFIPNEGVKFYFSAAELVVQPYKTATQSGISQIAYHFHKPMVVTHVGGLPEIVTDGKSGYVVEPVPSSIAEAMTDFFENNKEAEMRKAVEEEKKRFSWENLVEVVLE